MAEFYDPTKPFNEQTLELIQQTWPETGPIRVKKFGNSAVIEKDPEYWRGVYEIDTTDGIGTKGKLHWQMRTFDKAVQDAFAMGSDDLMMMGARPYRLQDHIILQEEDKDAIFSLTKHLVDICKQYEIIITGGETAICNTIDGMEMGITMIGDVEIENPFIPKIKEGNTVIGIGSNGLHSNGFTFVRNLIFDELGYKLDSELPYGKMVGEELTRPTMIYLGVLSDIFAEYRDSIRGMSHVTGGAYTKLLDLTANRDVDIEINNKHKLKPQDIFYFLKEKSGFPDEKMHKTFNCGVGYIVICDEEKTSYILDRLNTCHAADVIGRVVKGDGSVRVDSMFDNEKIVYQR